MSAPKGTPGLQAGEDVSRAGACMLRSVSPAAAARWRAVVCGGEFRDAVRL